MKLTTEDLNKYIDLYTNDVYDYGDETEILITESVLTPIKKLLVESKNKNVNLLGESYNKASQTTKNRSRTQSER